MSGTKKEKNSKTTKKELFIVGSKINGAGPVLYAWHPDGNYLASSGINRVVTICDRSGQIVTEISLQGLCCGLDWDKDGELMAIIQQGSGIITFWDKNSRKSFVLDTNMKEGFSFLSWSNSGPQLALGTTKGNILIYNKMTQKKVTISGRHAKRILSGAWNNKGLLAMGSEDKLVSVLNSEGEVIDQFTVKNEPLQIVFSEMKADKKSTKQENTISINMGQKTIYLYKLNDRDNPIELAFQPRYGNITTYKWFGDGYMMLGFSEGFFVVISTHMDEIGQELFQHKYFGALKDIAFSQKEQRIAACGDSSIKVVDVGNWKSVTDSFVVDTSEASLDVLSWTNDGQILSVSTTLGNVHCYLTKVPSISTSYAKNLAYLSSLRTVTIVETVPPSTEVTIEVAIEPQFLALGPNHLAVGRNNHVWFYQINAEKGNLSTSNPSLALEKEYLGTVDSICLNVNYAAVLVEGKVQLHVIDATGTANDRSTRLFPEKDEDVAITCIALPNDFLIFANARGSITYFYMQDWAFVNEYRNEGNIGIRKLFPNQAGTRLAFIDNSNNGVIFNPINDHTLKIPKFPSNIVKILWDTEDWAVFVASEIDCQKLYTYTYLPNTISGPTANQIAVSKLEKQGKYQPVSVHNGVVTVQAEHGGMTKITLMSHEHIAPYSTLAPDRVKKCFFQTLSLSRLKDSWELALKCKDKECWTVLSKEALRQLEIDLALNVFRQLGDTAMVLALEKILYIEEKNLLAGHVALLFLEYDTAERLFISSSRPITALEMRRDLLQWEQALKLAKDLAPTQIPYISREFAQQLEFKGDYKRALELYQKGMAGEVTAEHAKLCNAGVVAMTLRLGDISKGIGMALAANEKQLFRDSGAILESLKQMQEAAMLYEKGQQYDKAVSIYLQTKNYAQASQLMDKITSPKLFKLYGQAMEEQKKYLDAEKAYTAAKDVDSVIRINLDFLQNVEKAFELVRQTRSQEGARLAAKFCQTKIGDFRAAIEFLLMAKLPDEAFALAQKHGEMDKFAEALGDNGTSDDYIRIAQHYENRGDFLHAGHYYAVCSQYPKALKLFLQCGDTAIDKAIEVVGKAKNDALTHQLLDFLMGDTTGVPQDPHYIFHLHIALGNYGDAAHMAIIIARQEQEVGKYKNAHGILFDTYKDLEARNINIPSELKRNLMLLHSYILAKVTAPETIPLNTIWCKDAHTSVKKYQQVSSSYLNIDVGLTNPDVVPILTSTVVECQKAGLKRSSFEFSAVLVRPENRNKIDPAYKKKIEAFVRKPDKSEIEEELSPCPNCKFEFPRSELDCPACKNSLPYCIVTGNHMVWDDWSQCPSCHFPCLYSAVKKFVSPDKSAPPTPCPMCEQPLLLSQIEKIDNPTQILKSLLETYTPEEEPKK